MRAKWREAGISLALDDFGAGQTAVRHLPIWRFDIVKIDGGFTRDVHRNPDNQAMMGALMDLAHHFEAMTVVEHVENAADAAWLTARGAGGLQGHLFATASLHKPWRAAADADADRRHIA
jgi:EAL domain-containing protein (putative c-di-GMP-specific phosphodiesterase class I)